MRDRSFLGLLLLIGSVGFGLSVAANSESPEPHRKLAGSSTMLIPPATRSDSCRPGSSIRILPTSFWRITADLSAFTFCPLAGA